MIDTRPPEVETRSTVGHWEGDLIQGANKSAYLVTLVERRTRFTLIDRTMSKEAQDWYINLFKTLYESDEWQKYCVDEGLFCTEWVAGDNLGAFHATQFARHKQLIDKVGAAAITGQ